MSVEHYFKRFGFCPAQVTARPEAHLRMVIVIPCFDEPDLVGSLEALWSCARPEGAVEVIVVVNSSADASPAVLARNTQTLLAATMWQQTHQERALQLHLLHFPTLSPKQAGVGLARKIGMDEALHRFQQCGQLQNGIVVGFDADCRCDSDYLRRLERHFDQHPDTPGCSIYFEHPLEGPLDESVYRAVTEYELHLRYYIQALRYARYPHAYHTVGSSMAARASVYQAQGGMNKRTAGEDFYFGHKVIPLGGYTDLLATTVRPSPRPSHRVPFGTGRTIINRLEGKVARGYPLAGFEDLKVLFARIPELARSQDALDSSFVAMLPESIGVFLSENSFAEAWLEMQSQTRSAAALEKRFFRWFDGLRTLKFVHSARDKFHPTTTIVDEAARLLQILAPGYGGAQTEGPLLEEYRRLERAGVGSDGVKVPN